MIYQNLTRIIVVLLLFIVPPVVHAQPGGLSFDLPHPQKFENRQLRSEKTGDKKFTIPRKFMQNTTSHYNFFFNANEKIKEVLARAKASHKDDFTKLLSFYNYSFEETGRYKNDLDSVIYKSTAGILLHDLRSNWVDNFYLLMGRAYYLKKDFDSAYRTFQYLNYAFSPKEKDGYDKVIGSNSNEGGTAFSISTSEKTNIAKKLLSRRPSRNESLVWQVKTYIANDELPEAAGLIQTLKYDPVFPTRLESDLNESQAWYFYKQQAWDSAAVYLEQALGNADNKDELARWEYLIAQLYEATRHHDLAHEFYGRVVKHTIDPVMEVYAVLNGIRQNEGSDEKAIQDAVDALTKMGRRDKYVIYRDIIYYTAAQIELDRKHDSAAKRFLEKSIFYSIDNPKQKSRSFLALADIDFEQRNFIDAKRFYDSTDINTIAPEDIEAFKARKAGLTVIAAQQMVIMRQDSLQKIAALPEAERTAFLKKMLKQLRKQQGLKEEDASFGNANPNLAGNNNNAPVDLFNSASAKTDWYFANTALKSKGFNDFKTKWGNRPNADNWQRAAAVKQASAAAKNNAGDPNQPGAVSGPAAEEKPLSLDALKDKLPLTAEKLKVSNDSILQARFAMGRALQDNLEEYADAVEVYEKLRSQFPGSPLEEKTLFNLYYCYTKLGNTQKAAEIKGLMESRFGNSKLTAIIEHPVPADSGRKQEGSLVYDSVYNLFIEGKFEEALGKKKVADSLYGKHYWSPQLLYIEAVYHVHQRNDSAAKTVLNNINILYPGTPMAAKAKTMIEVLSRRKQIEDYLTKLQIERVKDNDTAVATLEKPVAKAQVGTPMVQGAVVNKVPVRKLITDSAQTAKNKTGADSAAAKKPVVPVPGSFANAPEQPHYAVLVMDKVDPVYVSEAKNAFNRYNKEKYYNQQIDITPTPLTDDIRFVLIGPFDNAAKAIEYLDKVRPLAPTEIIPWMPAAKYSFIVINAHNEEVLQQNKDIPAYKKFLAQNFKDSFK